MLERRLLATALVLALTPLATAGEDRIVVGSKTFTESHLLGEIMAQLLEARTELTVERRMGLGGTLVCQAALESGELDVYAEYTGTGWTAVLGETEKLTDPLRTYLTVQARYREHFDVEWLQPLGLNNTYALAMVEERAEGLGIRRISDLLAHGDALTAGFSLEFLNREDGWVGLQRAYGLTFRDVRGMEHGLAYEALNAGAIDLIEAYSTDGKLLRYRLRILADDRAFFPPYDAAPVVRGAVLRAHPEVRTALEELAFRLPDAKITALNHRIEEGGEAFTDVARDFLEEEGLLAPASETRVRRRLRGEGSFFAFFLSRWRATVSLTLEHVWLSGIAVLLAIVLALPLGILTARRAHLRRIALGMCAVIQTIPSLALLAFLIPFLGLGVRSAITALFLYALLPILRNTLSGLASVDPELIEAARGMGLREKEILVRVQLPLAVRTILAGIRTAAVISVGVATLAAFIGAGGLGEPIATGLYLNDAYLILSGAIPAALLALFADLVLAGLERALTPRGLVEG